MYQAKDDHYFLSLLVLSISSSVLCKAGNFNLIIFFLILYFVTTFLKKKKKNDNHFFLLLGMK